MKKFTYEITIKAEHENDADTRMKGLSLLTQCPVHKQKDFPVSEEEELLVRQYRAGDPLAKLSLFALACLLPPAPDAK